MVERETYASVFSTKGGKLILEELKTQFYNKPGYVKGENELDLAHKAGQRDTVDFIMAKMKPEKKQ